MFVHRHAVHVPSLAEVETDERALDISNGYELKEGDMVHFEYIEIDQGFQAFNVRRFAEAN